MSEPKQKYETELLNKLAANIKETGIFIRAKRGGKKVPTDYLNLNPEEVQEEERWDAVGWNLILDQILGRIGQAASGEKTPHASDVIRGILALIREVGIVAQEEYIRDSCHDEGS